MGYFHFENCTALTKVLFCCLGDILCSFSTAHPKKFGTTYTTMREREVYLITVIFNTVASSYKNNYYHPEVVRQKKGKEKPKKKQDKVWIPWF